MRSRNFELVSRKSLSKRRSEQNGAPVTDGSVGLERGGDRVATTRKRRSGAKKSRRRPSSSFTTTSTYALTVKCFGQVTGWKALLVSVRRFPFLLSRAHFLRWGRKLTVLSVSRCPLCTPYGHLQIHPQLGHHWASRDETEVTRAYSSSSFLFPLFSGGGKRVIA